MAFLYFESNLRIRQILIRCTARNQWVL